MDGSRFKNHSIILLIIMSLFLVSFSNAGQLFGEAPEGSNTNNNKSEFTRGVMNTRSRALIEKNGNWVVSGNEQYNGDTIIVTGNLYITTSGVLTLANVRLIMNCSSEGQYTIQVNGSIFGPKGELNGMRTTIHSSSARFMYKFKVNGTMTLNRCTVSDVWGLTVLQVEPTLDEVGGIEIRSNSVVIQRSRITNFKGFAICCMGSAPTIQSNVIAGNMSRITDNAGIYCAPLLILPQSPEIYYNNITNCSVGIRSDADNPIIKYNNISTRNGYNLVGIASTFLADPTIENNNIINNALGILFLQGGGTVQNNHIKTNQLGIWCMMDSDPGINGNTIEDNDFGGINLTGSSPDITNNDIIDNGWDMVEGLAGITCDNSQSLIQQNTIIAPYGHNGINNLNGSSPTIYDNDITSGNAIDGSNGAGIKCIESSAGTITNNDILVYPNGNGIECSSASPTIAQNNITVQDSSTGIYIVDDSHPTINDNNIYGQPLTGLARSRDSYNGIHFDSNLGSVKSQVLSNTIENFTNGIMCYGSGNIGLEDNIVTSVGNYAVYILDSDKINVSQISLPDNYVMVENSSVTKLTLMNAQAKSLNSTLGQTSVDKDSQLTVIWYLHLEVTDSNDVPIENADVTILNSSGIAKYNYKTPTNGLKRWIRCIEYIEEDRDQDGVCEKNTETPHNIQVEKNGFHPGIHSTDMTESKLEIIMLQLNHAPTAPSWILPLETHNLTPNITWQPSSDPDVDIITYHISVWEGDSSTTGNLVIDDNTTILPYYNLTTELRYFTGNNTYYLELLAADDYGGISVMVDHHFYVVNHPPEIFNLGNKTVKVGEVLKFNVTASDPDTDPSDTLKFSEDCDKFEIDPETGEVYWVPAEVDTGVYEVEFQVEDGNGGVDARVINITVISLNLPPIPDAGVDLTVSVNTTVTLNGTGSYDEDGIVSVFEWNCTTHEVEFDNAGSSTPSFTPAVEGNYSIVLRVMDDNLTWSAWWDTVNITVITATSGPGVPNTPPELKNGSVFPKEGTDKINYTFTVEYRDEDNDAPGGDGYICVIVDGNKYSMIPQETNWTDYRNGTVYRITIDGALIGTGNHTFRFEAFDGQDFATGDVGNHTDLTVNPYKPKSGKDDDLDDFFAGTYCMLLLLAIIIIIIVIIIVIALVLTRRKRGREPYYEQQPYDGYYGDDEIYESRPSRPRRRPIAYDDEEPAPSRRAPPSRAAARIDWDEDQYQEGAEFDEEPEKEDYEVEFEDEDEADWDGDEEDEEETEWED